MGTLKVTWGRGEGDVPPVPPVPTYAYEGLPHERVGYPHVALTSVRTGATHAETDELNQGVVLIRSRVCSTRT